MQLRIIVRVVFKRELTLQPQRCIVNEQQINQNILLIMYFSSTYISITLAKNLLMSFLPQEDILNRKKMNGAQRELCESIMLLNCQSYSNAILRAALVWAVSSIYILKKPCSICFLFTLLHYFGSEESEQCFETNVSAHDYHALIPVMEQFLKHELDSFYIKLKGKMLSSSAAKAMQPQTGLQSVGLD